MQTQAMQLMLSQHLQDERVILEELRTGMREVLHAHLSRYIGEGYVSMWMGPRAKRLDVLQMHAARMLHAINEMLAPWQADLVALSNAEEREHERRQDQRRKSKKSGS